MNSKIKTYQPGFSKIFLKIVVGTWQLWYPIPMYDLQIWLYLATCRNFSKRSGSPEQQYQNRFNQNFNKILQCDLLSPAWFEH